MESIDQIVSILSLIIGLITWVWLTITQDFFIGILSGMMAVMLTWLFSMFMAAIVMSAIGV